jgi:hypothetical protein
MATENLTWGHASAARKSPGWPLRAKKIMILKPGGELRTRARHEL